MKIVLRYLESLEKGEVIIEAKVGDIPRPDENTSRVKEIVENREKKSILRKTIEGTVGITKSIIGVGLAPDDVIEGRRSACETCSFRKGKKCGKCGCQIIHKTRLAEESCPMGYWGSVETDQKKRSGGCGCGKNKTY